MADSPKNAKEIYGYEGKVVFQVSDDTEYITDNPNRRCPNISKAENILGYNPSIYVDEGISRFLQFCKHL